MCRKILYVDPPIVNRRMERRRYCLDTSYNWGHSWKFCFQFWLIWFINQRALYNHALSVVVIGVSIVVVIVICAHPPGTWLDIETSYLVHTCTCVPPIHSVPHNSNSLISNYRLFRRLPSAPKITPLTQC